MTKKPTELIDQSPIHLRHRPRKFADLIGQAFIAETLSKTLERGAIAPAYLFSGSRGTGKTTTARIFARGLNCQETDRPTSTPCGGCDSCQAIANGNDLDVTEIDAASNNGVEFARELRERAQFRAVRGRYKVYVIDEAHMLTTAAQNALLKVLEEPPSKVVFVLATTDPQKLLDTIRSRCHEFRFKPAPVTASAELLEKIATAEGIDLDPQAAKAIASATRGGLRDAQTLLGLLATRGDRITPDLVTQALNSVDPSEIVKVVSAIESANARDTLAAVRGLLEASNEPAEILDAFVVIYRDLLSVAAVGSLEVAASPETVHDSIERFAKETSLAALIPKLDRLRRASRELTTSVSDKQKAIWLEVLALELATMGATTAVPQPPLPSMVATPQQTKPDKPPTKLPTANTSNSDDDFDFSTVLAEVSSRLARKAIADSTINATPDGVVTVTNVRRVRRHQSTLLEAYHAAGFDIDFVDLQEV